MTRHSNTEFFQVFGHISVFFATMDLLVIFLALRLVNPKKKDVVIFVTSNSTLGQKLRRLKALDPEDVTNPGVLSELKEFIDEAITVSDERNRYIHDQWLFDSESESSGKIRRLRLEGFDEKRRLPTMVDDTGITLQEMYTFLSVIGEMQKKINALHRKLVEDETSNPASQGTLEDSRP